LHGNVGSWSVAQVHPPCLAQAERNLKRQGFEFYNPIYLKRVKNRGHLIWRKLPLFPGYLFVRIYDQWRALLSTYGVSGLLLSAGLPATLPHTVVDAIRAREDETGCVQLGKMKFRVGEAVQIKKGPLCYEVGICEGQRDHDRVRVLLNLLGRTCLVEISEENLVAV